MTDTPKHQISNLPPSKRVTVVIPSKGWFHIDWREIWHFRELFFTLTLRDIRVRYKQTAVGFAWAVIQPLMTMVVFSLFFGGLAGVPTDDGIAYPIFSYAALVPWQFFAGSLTSSAQSIVSSSNLVKKIYFPRIILPVSSVMAQLVDFFLAFLILLIMMPFFGIYPDYRIIFFPLFLLFAIMTALGIGLWFSAINVVFRDVRFTIPFVIQMWLFISPVVYSSSLIENDILRLFYNLNPMVGVINGFRWSLIGSSALTASSLVVSVLVSVTLLVSGLWYFRRQEKTFADVV